MTTLHPHDLNLRHLQAVGAILRRGSMNAAASAVSLSQPALTQGLAKLERQLHAALFVRHTGGMDATAAGRIVAERAERAFHHLARGGRGAGRGFARPERLMTAAQLRAMVALADAGSFVAAGARTGLSQPAVHRAVRELEEILGSALAERRGRGVALTPAGLRMAREARLAIAEIAAAIAEVGGTPVDGGAIAIGAMPLCRARLLPAALTRFLAERPDARLTIVEGSWRELVEPLRDGAIDLMIGALRPAGPLRDLVQQPLFEDRLIVVAGPHHPLAGQAAPALAALAAHPWIVGPAGSPLRDHWQALFAGGAVPRAPVECGSVIAIREMLRQSDLLTLLSPDQIAVEIAAGTLVRIGRPLVQCVRTIGITTRASWQPTGGQRRLLDLLAQSASSTIP